MRDEQLVLSLTALIAGLLPTTELDEASVVGRGEVLKLLAEAGVEWAWLCRNENWARLVRAWYLYRDALRDGALAQWLLDGAMP